MEQIVKENKSLNLRYRERYIDSPRIRARASITHRGERGRFSYQRTRPHHSRISLSKRHGRYNKSPRG